MPLQGLGATVPLRPAEYASRHGEFQEGPHRLLLHSRQLDRTLYAEGLLHQMQDNIRKICEPQLPKLLPNPVPVQGSAEVPEERRHIQIHSDSCPRAGDMLGNVGQQIHEMKLRLELVAAVVVCLGIPPQIPEVPPVVRLVGDIDIHDLRMDLIVFYILNVSEHRFPVSLRLISQATQQRVALRPVLQTDDDIDIAKGSQLRHRVIRPQDIALHHDMVDPVPGQGLAEHLRQRRPAGKQRDGVQANASQGCFHLFVRADMPGHGHIAQNSGNAVDLAELHQFYPVHILPHLGLFLPKVGP